ncbi:MAG: FAD/NAD(P)-binding protein [Hydrogenophaga sp.]|nr:FAD/NAD(P)-binding protein [Hydrogenophaga sp.]
MSRRIVIVGGGFAGVSAAVQLMRRSPAPLAITLIEERERVGPGLAYATHDPDHRLNGPTWVHSVDPLDGEHFTRWCVARGVFESDPKALQPSGSAFVRRAVLGAYLEDQVRAHAHWAPTGSTLHTVQARVVGAVQRGGELVALTDHGQQIAGDLLLLATGNAVPRLQAPLSAALAAHPGVIENPLDTARLLNIPRAARVLIIGSGLTALDVICTLQRQGHTGGAVVVSRRGLRPRPQPPLPPGASLPLPTPGGRDNLDRVLGPAPDFLLQAEPTLRAWVKALRAQARHAQGNWYPGFDALRDTVWQLWPRLPQAQQRRFLKRLRTWYDVHRFRSPPQTEAIVNRAIANGRVQHRAARLRGVRADGQALVAQLQSPRDAAAREERFDVLVNCTGLDVAARTANNPLLQSLRVQGWLQSDALGVGYAVDAQCRLLGSDGQARARVRLVGPPTLGTFGDPGGAMYIAAQIHRIVPDVLATLGIAGGNAPQADDAVLSAA